MSGAAAPAAVGAADARWNAPAAVALPRIPELDGLRAILAWWVVLYHASSGTFSAAYELHVGPFAWLSNGGAAVTVFMMLSGFVIFFLLDREHEGYAAFLVRRFFRLYPVYAASIAVMIPLTAVYIANVQANGPHLEPARLAGIVADAEEPLRALPAQLVVHALMLHGAVPAALLRNAAGAFVMPAWSISLEWQFYLVAPAIYALLRRGGSRGAALWIAASAAAFALRPRSGVFGFDAFLPLQLHTFTIGIACYYAWKALALSPRKPALLRFGPLAVLAGVGLVFVVQSIRFGPLVGTTPTWWSPYALWAFVFASLLADAAGVADPLARAAVRVLRWPALERLGVASYSTYLVHWPVLVVCQAAFRHALDHPSPWTLFALHLAISLPLVAALSFALHRTVEAPGIAFGRGLARRLAARA